MNTIHSRIMTLVIFTGVLVITGTLANFASPMPTFAQETPTEDTSAASDDSQAESTSAETDDAKQEDSETNTNEPMAPQEENDSKPDFSAESMLPDESTEQKPKQEQLETDQPETIVLADTLPELYKQYEELNIQLQDLQAAFDETEDRPEVRRIHQEYLVIFKDTILTIKKMERLAIEKVAAGESDQKIYELLIGIMINDAVNKKDESVLTTGQIMIDAGINARYFEAAARSKRMQPISKQIFEELVLRHQEAQQNDLPRVQIETNKGTIVVELFENEAPQTVGNFISLVEQGFYDGTKFHRVLDDFMAQCGCPHTKDETIERDQWGSGGAGYSIYCECAKSNARRNFADSICMARAPGLADTGSSQFFINFSRNPDLDGGYTVFGRVIEGRDVLPLLQRRDPKIEEHSNPITPDWIEKAVVLRKRDHEYVPTKVE